MKAKILIVDDDPDIVTMLEDRLQASEYGTVTAQDGVQALEMVEQEAPHLMLLDLDMPRLTGLEVLKRLPKVKTAEDLPVIVMTAHGSIQAAVEAMKDGAYDFLTKPLDKDHLLIVIGKALERDSLKRQVACLKSEVDGRYTSIVGTSTKIRAVLDTAQRAAKSDASVLLLGDSGTGKELLARSIHQWSPRHAMPLVVINCVALTETLLENELFGHERGAFTGADRLQKGKLEMADGGTVFWTRSATCRSRFKPNSYGSSRTVNFIASAVPVWFRSTFASLLLRIRISNKQSRLAIFAKTCFSAST